MHNELVNDLKERAQSIYGYMSGLAQEYMPQNWYKSQMVFEIKENNEINGKSWCAENEDHIEINYGVIDLYVKYFEEVMKLKTTSVLQILEPDLDEEGLNNYSYEGIFFKDGKGIIFDSKWIDNKMSKMLEIFVSRFIFLHELGHVFNGHCKLVAAQKFSQMSFMPMYYDDSFEKKIKEKEALDIRTMEMDADAFAVTQSMRHLLYLYKNFETEVEIKAMKPQELFYWWSFSIRSHFLVCEDGCLDKEYDKRMTHLPSNDRWILIFFSAIKMCKYFKVSEEEKKIFEHEITRGADEAEKVFNRLKYTNYNWKEEAKSNFQWVEYCDEINRNWDKLRIQLDEYSRLPLYEKICN